MKLPVIPIKGDTCSTGLQSAPVREPGALLADQNFAGNVTLVTLGCAKNLVDSEIMLGALKARGFRSVPEPENADLIVVNTCAFLQSAVEEGIDRILELSELKRSGRCRKLVVAGCMVERYRNDLIKELPEVDRFISTDELLTIADEAPTSKEIFDVARRPYFLYDESMPRVRSTLGHTAFLKIAEGCNRPCAFCIIPKIRGGFRSRSVESVTSEARLLLADGVRELNLVAQDLTAYGSDFEGNRGIKSELPKLLAELSRTESPHPFWVRLFYAYPIGVTEELIRQIADSPVLCNYLDLPLQHISNTVLKRMHRPLGEKNTRRLIEMIRTIAPQVALRTTFVVGFPGETEEDIQSLEQFVGEGHFTHVGAFSYSQEEEAESFTFEDQVEDAVKEERRSRIMTLQQKLVEARGERLLGTRHRVLLDGSHEESDLLLSARTEWQGPETDGEVIINDVRDEFRSAEGDFNAEQLTGKFGTVEITDVAGYDLVGTLVEVESA